MRHDRTGRLHCKLHDGTDNISFSLLEGLDSLCPADASLCHDKLNILGLYTALINVTLLFILLNQCYTNRTVLSGNSCANTSQDLYATQTTNMSKIKMVLCNELCLWMPKYECAVQHILYCERTNEAAHRLLCSKQLTAGLSIR